MNDLVSKPMTVAFLLLQAVWHGWIVSVRGYLGGQMQRLLLVSSTAGITKAIRDVEKSERLHNKIEDAQTERLLTETSITV